MRQPSLGGRKFVDDKHRVRRRTRSSVRVWRFEPQYALLNGVRTSTSARGEGFVSNKEWLQESRLPDSSFRAYGFEALTEGGGESSGVEDNATSLRKTREVEEGKTRST